MFLCISMWQVMWFVVYHSAVCQIGNLFWGISFPFMETVATDRRPQDDSQTDQVPDQLYYYYDILFLLIYQSFFLLLNSHFYDKMLLFLLHHYHVTLPTPQPLEIKEVTNHRFWIFIVISRWSKLVLLAAGVMIVISASICRVIFSTLNGTEGIL